MKRQMPDTQIGNQQVPAAEATIPASLLGCTPEKPAPLSLSVPLSVPSPGQNSHSSSAPTHAQRVCPQMLVKLMRKDPLFSASTYLLNRNGNHSEHTVQAWSPAWTTPHLLHSYSPYRSEL